MLLGLGLQHKSVEDLEKDLDLPASQLLGLFVKIIRKLVTFLNEVMEKDVEKTMVERQDIELVPAAQSIDEELVRVEMYWEDLTLKEGDTWAETQHSLH